MESIHARLKQKGFLIALAEGRRAPGCAWVYEPNYGTEIKDVSRVLRDLELDVSPELFRKFFNSLPGVTAEMLHKNLGADIRIVSGAGDFDTATGYINRNSPEWLPLRPHDPRAGAANFDSLAFCIERFQPVSKETLNALTRRLEDPSFRIQADPAVRAVQEPWGRPVVINFRTGEPFRPLVKEDCVRFGSVVMCATNPHAQPSRESWRLVGGKAKAGETWETLDQVLVQWMGADATNRFGFCALRAALGLPWSFPGAGTKNCASSLMTVFSSSTQHVSSEPSLTTYNPQALKETHSWKVHEHAHADDSLVDLELQPTRRMDEYTYLCEMRFPTFFEWTMRVRWSVVYSYARDILGNLAWIVVGFLVETRPPALVDETSHPTSARVVCSTLARLGTSSHCHTFRHDLTSLQAVTQSRIQHCSTIFGKCLHKVNV
jgi:hypothetical protein